MTKLERLEKEMIRTHNIVYNSNDPAGGSKEAIEAATKASVAWADYKLSLYLKKLSEVGYSLGA